MGEQNVPGVGSAHYSVPSDQYTALTLEWRTGELDFFNSPVSVARADVPRRITPEYLTLLSGYLIRHGDASVLVDGQGVDHPVLLDRLNRASRISPDGLVELADEAQGILDSVLPMPGQKSLF